MPSGWGPSLPITRSDEDGFKLTKEIKEQIKQNFKMLLLTIPGERTWDINFGIGLKKYLFEPNVESTHRTIALRIDEQVRTYLPYIVITQLEFIVGGTDGKSRDEVLGIKLGYAINTLGLSDDIILDFSEGAL